MINWDKEIDEVLNDPFFETVKAPRRTMTSSDRIIQSFQKVLDFVIDHKHLPSLETTDSAERQLAIMFKGITDRPANVEKCRPYDTEGILPAEASAANEPEGEYGTAAESEFDMLDDIFNDPLFATDSETDTTDLFDMPDFMREKMKERMEADYVGGRKPCEDFPRFEDEFKAVRDGIKNGVYRLKKFSEKDLRPGRFFVDEGIIAKVEAISDMEKNRHGRTDGRLRIIYDNGMESDIKYRTFTKHLASNGYSIQEAENIDAEFLHKKFSVTESDVLTGYIYVLRSKSTDPEIASRKNLHKIGFTATSIESRLANAAKETTYLCAPVEIVNTWKVFNVKSSTLEALIHRLFAQVQFHVKVNNDRPREWYVVPYPIIEQAINYIISGVQVAYDHNIQQLVILGSGNDLSSDNQPSDKLYSKPMRSSKSATQSEGGKDFIFKKESELAVLPTKENTLYLPIMKEYFDLIIAGKKKEEYREIKQTSAGRYLLKKNGAFVLNPETTKPGKTYSFDDYNGGRFPFLPRPFRYLSLAVGYHSERDSALVEIKGFHFDPDIVRKGKTSWTLSIILGDLIRLHRK